MLRHHAEEDAVSGTRLKDVAALETHALQRGPHGANHLRRGVVTEERNGCCALEFLGSEKRFQPRMFLGIEVVRGIEHLLVPPPSAELREHLLFRRSSVAVLLFERAQRFEGGDVRLHPAVVGRGRDVAGLGINLVVAGGVALWRARMGKGCRFGADYGRKLFSVSIKSAPSASW